VRGRDVAGFVAEAKRKIAAAVRLPEGYWLDWGGQFENMERANRRLRFVVPMALGLILTLLYFSLKSFRDVFVVATGIPLARWRRAGAVAARHAVHREFGHRVHRAPVASPSSTAWSW